MNREEDNKAVVSRWFTEFWGKEVNLAVIDEIAAPNMLLNIRCMSLAVAARISRRS
jgi:hypothetical protein